MIITGRGVVALALLLFGLGSSVCGFWWLAAVYFLLLAALWVACSRVRAR